MAIYFRNAAAYYQRGEPVDYQTYGTERRRPEDTGADLVRFGKRPVPWSMMAILFGTTVSALRVELRKWEAELWQKGTLYIDAPSTGQGAGVVLRAITPVTGTKRIINATNNANYYMWINLVFARMQSS